MRATRGSPAAERIGWGGSWHQRPGVRDSFRFTEPLGVDTATLADGTDPSPPQFAETCENRLQPTRNRLSARSISRHFPRTSGDSVRIWVRTWKSLIYRHVLPVVGGEEAAIPATPHAHSCPPVTTVGDTSRTASPASSRTRSVRYTPAPGVPRTKVSRKSRDDAHRGRAEETGGLGFSRPE